MATSQILKTGPKFVRPILSADQAEAKRRVVNLYRSWYRQIPYIVLDFDIPKSVEQCREKLRAEFRKNEHVKDTRVIDMLVIKGQMELMEAVNGWKQNCHIMTYFKDTQEPKPEGFLSKFISGNN